MCSSLPATRASRVRAGAVARGRGGGAAWRRSFFASPKGRLELERLNATRETLALGEESAGERRESAEAHEAFGRAEERASALERELESAAGKAARRDASRGAGASEARGQGGGGARRRVSRKRRKRTSARSRSSAEAKRAARDAVVAKKDARAATAAAEEETRENRAPESFRERAPRTQARLQKATAILRRRALPIRGDQETRAPPPKPPPRRRASRSRASSGMSRRRARSDHLGERAERLEADLRVASDAKSALLEERASRVSETEAKRVEMEQTAEAWKREAFDKLTQTFEADLERARFERDRAEDARAELAERLAQSESRNERAFDASLPKTTPGGVVSDAVVSDAVGYDAVSIVPNTPGST